jgi:hypothetical protein
LQTMTHYSTPPPTNSSLLRWVHTSDVTVYCNTVSWQRGRD